MKDSEKTDSVVDVDMVAAITKSDKVASGAKVRCSFEMNDYRFMSAETHEDLEKVWRLKYQTYCVELGVEPENHSGFLKEEHDEYATHFLAIDTENRAVGTIRFVPNNPKGFPMETDFPLSEYMKAKGITKAVEGGRIIISKEAMTEDRSKIAFGLFRCIIEYCSETGINDIFTITHLKIAQRYLMPGFEQIGEPFEYEPPLSGVLWVPMHCDIRISYWSQLTR